MLGGEMVRSKRMQYIKSFPGDHISRLQSLAVPRYICSISHLMSKNTTTQQTGCIVNITESHKGLWSIYCIIYITNVKNRKERLIFATLPKMNFLLFCFQ